MSDKKKITALPPFWIILITGGFCVIATLIYDFVPLSGKLAFAFVLPTLGMGLLFGLSCLMVLATPFWWKKYQMPYLPILMAVVGVIFLYYSQGGSFLQTPTFKMNTISWQFYQATGFDLPSRIYAVNESDDYDGGRNGDTEISFYMNSADLTQWMNQSGLHWVTGALPSNDVCPYSPDPSHDNCTDTINEFWGPNDAVQFKNNSDLMSVTIDASRANDPNSSLTRFVVDPRKGWVLMTNYFR